jgi:glycosyltransferase involved in cell wall biosynthesis
MRLLHVSPSFYPAHLYGGPVVSLHRLACAQAWRPNLEVRVLTSDANGPGRRLQGLGGRWVEDYGVPTYYARATARQDFSLELCARLPSCVRWADIVHVTAVFSPTSMAALLAGLSAQRTVVVSPRGSLLPWAIEQGGPRKRAVLSALTPLLRRIAGWHATSEDEAEALHRLRLLGPRAQASVIENGVDLGPSRSVSTGRGALLSRILRPGEGPILTVLGRIDPVKGIDLAIAALGLLRLRHPGAVLVVAGPDRDGHGPPLRALAERLGLADVVRFPGLVVDEDKAGLLTGSDLLWLCSRMESFGNVVLEALAAGTPVVAVQTTPWRWLEEAAVGRFVPPTPEALAAASSALLSQDGAARQALRARCQEQVAARFSWPAIAARMNDLYEACLPRQV